ncbi:PDZ and LIM domain protein 3 isoform X2 [Tribolium castaneum]|uniref:PDZ and LIM domain protein 3 isoform X2 n=1 Tax=Tribolium castaneum TaxID=7070 RepID=UPI0000D5604E|nr:PREDICTED: PDZ and LIM domain protein 3 isoform X2 [Tribolium castaneum]|eukprot:XP_967133.1 PREDICTED: PDZ and LIM domain protein 3 isoform X2 [Tribolium castaneum]
MGKTHQIVLNLRRDSPTEQWGFSLVGGADVKMPLIVTRVGFGSPSNGVLQRGDIITKVGNYDARDIRHQDAQTLFKNAGNNIRVVVQRENNPRHNTSTGSSRTSSHNYSPLSVSPHLSPKGNYSTPSPYSPAGSALTPYYSSPLTPIDDNYFEPVYYGSHKKQDTANGQDIHVTNQPYRTTPLVLPGAKVKREPGPTESYLRHHPNPAVRAPPHHLDPEHLIKQKVTNTVLERLATGDPNKQLVHKQFNSPINLYSEPNIADTIQKQTGINPIRKQVKFNPAESETYKALQEEQLGETVQEVTVPPQSRIYAPNKTIPAKKSSHHVVNQNPSFSNSLGDPEVIQQSGSFKRLMWSVLPESSY